MQVSAIKTRIFLEGESLYNFVTEHVGQLRNKSILVVTSKIVALAENRTLIIKNARTKQRAIQRESDWAVKTKYAWLTLKDGLFMAAAGIDESNGNGKLILLPEDSFNSAEKLRRRLMRHYQIKNLGVVITDSRTSALRAGVTGVSLGYSGFCGIRDYIGKPDIFGRKFHMSKTNIADSLASAAVLLMGEGAERHPLAIIIDAPVTFAAKINRDEIKIPLEDDLYKPLFNPKEII